MQMFTTANQAKEYIKDNYTLVTNELVILGEGKIGPSQSYTTYGYIFDNNNGSFQQVAVKGNYGVPRVPNSNNIYFEERPYEKVSSEGIIYQKDILQYLIDHPESLASIKMKSKVDDLKAERINSLTAANIQNTENIKKEFLFHYPKYLNPTLKELDQNKQNFLIKNIESLDLNDTDKPKLEKLFENTQRLKNREIKLKESSTIAYQIIGDLDPRSLTLKIEAALDKFNPNITYNKQGNDKAIGYKVMKFDEEENVIISGANSSIVYSGDDIKKNKMLAMEGNGIYVGINKEYVMDYYSNLAEKEVLLKVEFDLKDITTGNITDKEPELSVTKVKLLEAYLIEEGEIVSKLHNNKEVKMKNENIKLQSGLYFVIEKELIPENDYLNHYKDEIGNDINIIKDNNILFELNDKDLQHSTISLPNEIGKWDFEDIDLELTHDILDGLNIKNIRNEFDCNFGINDNYNKEAYLVYKQNDEIIVKTELHNSNLTLEQFIEENTIRLNDSFDFQITEKQVEERIIENIDFSVLENPNYADPKYTALLLSELKEKHPDHQILKMHNEEDRKAYSTQVEDLTNNKLTFGNFKSEKGYLINKDKSLIIVLPEAALVENNLINQVKENFNFSTLNNNFLIKQDVGDIDYLVRENNMKGEIEIDNTTFQVFEKKPLSNGDKGVVYLLQIPVNEKQEDDIKFLNDELAKIGFTVTSFQMVGSDFKTICKSDTCNENIVLKLNKDNSDLRVGNMKFLMQKINRKGLDPKEVETTLISVLKECKESNKVNFKNTAKKESFDNTPNVKKYRSNNGLKPNKLRM